MRTRHQRGFTLIEILVVITIIALLGGMVMRLGNLVYQKIARATEARRIEHLRLCLEEYYKIYGIYPPTKSMNYESPVDGVYGDEEEWERKVRAARRTAPNFNTPPSTGLVYYLAVDIGGDNDYYFTDDHEPENAAWLEYWKHVGVAGVDYGKHLDVSIEGYGRADYSNRILGIQDSWQGSYHYVSEVPFQSYRLWSPGPDTLTWDTDLTDKVNRERVADDVGFEAWVE